VGRAAYGIFGGLVRRLMTSADRNDLLTAPTAQEKLEWVTPKISLMEAGDTERKTLNTNEFCQGQGAFFRCFGPS